MSQTATKARTRSGGAAWKRGKTRTATARRSRGDAVQLGGLLDGEKTKVASREIEEYLCVTFGIQKPAATRVWDAILERLRGSLLQGRPVTLTNIGTIEPYTKKESTFRHPTTGKLEKVPARRYVRFLLSPSLKTELRAE